MSLTYPYLLSRHPKATTDHDVSLDHHVDICGLRRHYLAADEEPGPGHRGGRDRPQHCAHDGAAAGAGPGRQVRPNRWHLGGPAVDQLILAPLHINVHSDKGGGRPRLPASYSLSRRVVIVEELAGLVRRGERGVPLCGVSSGGG